MKTSLMNSLIAEIIVPGAPKLAIQLASNLFFLDLTTTATPNPVTWSIICNIGLPLLDFKSADTTLLKSFDSENATMVSICFFLYRKQNLVVLVYKIYCI